MMKEKFKGLLAGVIIGTMITGGSVLAFGSTTLYDVITDGVKIVVDGKKLNPTDANGNEVQPMIYNGTTYLPVRAVANALGKAVYWDGPNYTVYLGEMDGELEYPTVYLKDMTDIGKGSVRFENTLTDNYGNTYNEVVRYCYGYNTNEGNYSEYLLNMKYSRFKATLVQPEGRSNDGENYVKIIADGKTIYTSPKQLKTSQPLNIDVNVKGCNDLKIVCGHSAASDTYLANAGFYQ